MKWEVRFKKEAQKDLAKIPKTYQKRILITLPILAENPYIGKKLGGKFKGAYSYRVWPYRIIYKIYKRILLVIIIRIGHRQRAYKK